MILQELKYELKRIRIRALLKRFEKELTTTKK